MLSSPSLTGSIMSDVERATVRSRHPIKVSAQVGLQLGTFKDQRAAWIGADELGVDVIFNWDHFFPSIPGADPTGSNLEAYMLLGSMAEVTHQAQIGSLVTCNSYRNPNLLADMARTLDHISGGRFVLGIGSGWMERDYNEYGYELGTAGSRLRDLARDLPIIEDRLGKVNPGPVNGHIPLLIGGSGEKVTLRLVAQHADIWHGGGSLEVIAHKLSVLDDWCAKVGRDPSEIECAIELKQDQEADIEAYIALGISHFVVNHIGPEYDLGRLRDVIRWRDERRAS